MEKLWCRPFAQNALPVKLRLNLLVRVMHVRKASTKIKTVRDSRTVVKNVLLVNSVTKLHEFLFHFVKIALLVVGRLPLALVSVRVLLHALPVARVCTMPKKDALVPLRASNALRVDTTTCQEELLLLIVNIVPRANTIPHKVLLLPALVLSVPRALNSPQRQPVVNHVLEARIKIKTMRRRCLVLRGQRAVLERTRRQHRISLEIVGALPVLPLNFKRLVRTPVPLVPIGANVHTVKKVLLLPALSIVCAVVVHLGAIKPRIIMLARHARPIPLVLLVRNNPTCPR